MENKSFTVKKTKKGGKRNATVIITEEISLNNAAQFKEKMQKLIAENEVISVDMKNIHAIDLPGIQLLYSALKTGKKQQKEIKVDLQVTGELEAIIEHAGFTGYFENL